MRDSEGVITKRIAPKIKSKKPGVSFKPIITEIPMRKKAMRKKGI